LFTVELLAINEKGCANSYSRTITALLPMNDLAIESLNYLEKNGYWELSAVLKNNGNLNISSFELSGRLDGKSVISENFTDSVLSPGESRNVIFSTRFIAASDYIPLFFCVDILSVNQGIDDVLSNNSRCITAGSTFAILELYPNPASNTLITGFQMEEQAEYDFYVFDMLGRSIFSSTGNTAFRGYNTFSYDCSSLSEGQYIIRLTSQEKDLWKKFVKRN
jgi:hypothetical protein